IRRGVFVGPEEVAVFVREVFSDRIEKREAHLAWAAEVTSTINVNALGGNAPTVSDASADALPMSGGDGAPAKPPSGQVPAIAALPIPQSGAFPAVRPGGYGGQGAVAPPPMPSQPS